MDVSSICLAEAYPLVSGRKKQLIEWDKLILHAPFIDLLVVFGYR